MPPKKEKKLLIVESFTKAKTIQSFLGNSYHIIATGGHIMDLPKNQLGIQIHKGFALNKITLPGKLKYIQKIFQILSQVDTIFLATDPDREGEAIAFDIKELISQKIKENAKFKIHPQWIRVGFREITREHVIEKLNHPDTFSKEMVESQMARRTIDRLFGYLISPILWEKIKSKNLSAGRVQSVLLNWICKREDEINQFKPEEYINIVPITKEGWKLQRLVEKPTQPFSKGFIESWLKLPNNPVWPPKTSKGQIPVDITFTLVEKKEGVQKKNPPPPFKTSTLQQKAYQELGWSPSKTMKIAQRLFEGVQIGNKITGLITYPRTDSERINNTFANQILKFINQKLGEKFVGKPIFFNSNESTGAHEAIRITNINWDANFIKKYLTKDEFSLYNLIYLRTLASFTSPQIIEFLYQEYEGMHERWFYKQEREVFKGFMVWYGSGEKVDSLNFRQSINVSTLSWEKKKTQPPPRYTYGSLVQKMEKTGVGRPSTYAYAISVLSERGYVEWAKKTCKPTELGVRVNNFLKENFFELIDENFTANLEENLDLIETGKIQRIEFISKFYKELNEKIKISKLKPLQQWNLKNEKNCPICQVGTVKKKKDKKGKIILYCSRFPECDYGEYQAE